VACYRDPWFDTFADYPDLYFLYDIDLPWVRDTVRYFGDPEKRRKYHLASERELTARKIDFIRISRSAKQRPAIAIDAVATLMR